MLYNRINLLKTKTANRGTLIRLLPDNASNQFNA